MRAWGWDSSAVSCESHSPSGQRNQEKDRLTSSDVDCRSPNLSAPFIGRCTFVVSFMNYFDVSYNEDVADIIYVYMCVLEWTDDSLFPPLTGKFISRDVVQ